MNVKKAKHSGFCFGVKRAVDSALKTEGEVKTLGPLIHNPQVVEKLSKQGVIPIDSVDDVSSGKLIIRSHGVPKSVIEKAESKDLEVIDATCPFVKKVQDAAIRLEQEGYQVIIVGEKHHPEVIGIMGNLKNPIVVGDLPGAEALPNYEKLAVVSQTTQPSKKFQDIVDILSKKSTSIKIENTICSATQEHQNAALELAKAVDVMVVVGGHNSGNTRRLAEICSNIVETHHIEQWSELKEEWFKGKKEAGVTAGTSTPDWIIDKVIERMENDF